MNPKELFLYVTQDTEHVRRNTIIQIVIATLAFILLCRVWPFGMVQRHTESVQQAYSSTADMTGDTFGNADKKLQTVRFSQEHLHQIMLYLMCNEYDNNHDYVIFRLYNDSFSCIYEETQSFGLLEKRGGFLATPDMDVELDKDYYYEIIIPQEVASNVILPIASRSSLAQMENTILYVDGIIREDISLVADFDYTKELTAFHIIALYSLVIGLAVFLYLGIIWLLYYYEDYLVDAAYYGKWAITIMAIIVAVAFFAFAVIRNGFGGEIADRFVYAVAAIVGVIWFYSALWIAGSKKKKSKLPANRQISQIWRNYIQTFSFALLFYALCQYVNADREYYHATNTRWMLIFLGIAFLMIYTEKEIRNIMSGIWLVLSFAGSMIYCYGIEGENELYLAKLSAAVVIIWGLVIITILKQKKKNLLKTINWPVFAVWVIFTILMYANRYQKAWPFVATLPFLAIIFMNLSASAKSRLLKNFTNGILLSFGLVMLFCLAHRPYHYWMRYRYNGIFHTVACTGTYLGVVSGAAIGKLYGKWKTEEKLFQTGKNELFLLAAVVTNIFLSMSRTAILTLCVNFVIVAVLSMITYRKEIKYVLYEAVIIVIAIVITFPLMYSVIRVVPAIINDPIRYELEPQDQSYMIYEGDKVDSDKYMTIRRYFTVFFWRFLTEEVETKNTKELEESDTLLAYIGKETLPVSLPTVEEGEVVMESESDVSNGRFEIYQEYINNLTIKGHDTMFIKGKDFAHAHNSYLQVAYDFGIPAGFVFLVLCAFTLWQAMMLAYRYGKNYSIYFVPFSLIVVFGFTSLTEWAFHPCIPTGFVFIFLQMLLMQKPLQRTGKGNDKGSIS